MRATSGFLKGLDPTVTIASKILVVSFVMFCAVWANKVGKYFESISDSLLYAVKWFYLGSVSAVVFFLLYLMVSRYGHIRLGQDNEKPEFRYTSWLAMLFSGGMGIGLIFWSVSEPMWHYANNPFSPPLSDDSASMAMRLTFFHWGLHPWSVFIIVALSLSYFAYRKNLPLTLRSTLYPLIGKKIYGPIGHVVDILTVAVTAFGVSQTLGMGVIQISAGLDLVFGIKIGLAGQLAFIVVLSTLSVSSVLSGVGKGFRRLAEVNMLLSFFMVLIVLWVGPTRFIFNSLLETTGGYVQNIIGMSLWSDAMQDSQWQNSWTAYYWPWWMTWAPFVGMFIARISRGRTIREMIGGALIVPTMISFIWISVFGGAALKIEQQARNSYQTSYIAQNQASSVFPSPFTGGPIVEATKKDTTLALFALFNNLSTSVVAKILSILTCLLLAIHFVITADAGTLVLSIINATGNSEPPPLIRVLWGGMTAAISAVLLYAGGLHVIQAASIIAGLPVAVFIILMGISLYRAIRREPAPWAMLPEHVHPDPEQLDGPVRQIGRLKAVSMHKKKI